jgi:hypothetical protein
MKSRIAHDSKSFKAWTAAAVTAAFFIPLGVFGAPALAKSAASASQYEYSGSSQYQYHGKVTMCHRTHSRKHGSHQITVGAAAVRAHLRHGDTLGACPATASSHHAKGHGKAKGHDKAKGDDQSGDDDDQGTHSSSNGNLGDAGKDHGKSGQHGSDNGHGKGHDK